MREFINGAEAISQAAIHAGCDFFAGYPITPATPILLQMTRELPKVNGLAIQAEDEISAIGFCIGAALTGARVMTATSGPGISLYSENIGAAIMVEVPLVIVDCQRLGPATGGATTVAQGDIQFLRWATSGGYPVIVLAPTDVQECYSFTLRAFDLAERFRLPVFIATDKETVLTRSTVSVESLKRVLDKPVRKGQREIASTSYDRGDLSSFSPLTSYGGPRLLRCTTSAHDQHGYLSKDPAVVGPLLEHLAQKVYEALDEISMVDMDLQDGATDLILSYGIVAQAVQEAVGIAREQGLKVSTLTVHSLWPVPEGEINSAMKGVKRVIVPELNLGQYRREIERLVSPDQVVIGVNRVDGELISPFEILKRGGFL
jgi:2-oxoglutarate/2-oxoacid ferredoxin oxidoreductase subunit alpha